MKFTKSIKAGKVKILYFIFFFNIIFYPSQIQAETNNIYDNPKIVEIKILDKVSSKSSKLVLEIGKEKKFKNLLIKCLKCKNSEFDDTPEVTAYIQVKDLNNSKKYNWQKPHLSNQTGTDNSYHPKKNTNEIYKKYKSWKS